MARWTFENWPVLEPFFPPPSKEIQGRERKKKVKGHLFVFNCPVDLVSFCRKPISFNMSAIGTLVFCTDCGSLLEGSIGDPTKILVCDVCGARNKGRFALLVF